VVNLVLALQEVAADVAEVVCAVADAFGQQAEPVNKVVAEKVEARDAVGEHEGVGRHEKSSSHEASEGDGGGEARRRPDGPAARLYLTRPQMTTKRSRT
jgi:hypothetical protein